MESDRTAGPAECEGNQLSSAECLSSAGYTPDNMPVAQAEEHRSKAGQGRQFHCPQSILSDALLWYRSQLGATPGGGSNFVAVRSGRTQAPQSSQPSSEHHKPAVPRAALGTATIFRLLAEALPTSFVRESCRGSTGGRLQLKYF